MLSVLFIITSVVDDSGGGGSGCCAGIAVSDNNDDAVSDLQRQMTTLQGLCHYSYFAFFLSYHHSDT